MHAEHERTPADKSKMKITNPTDMLTATVSFRLTDDEWRTLELRADREQRTVSQLVRLLLRNVFQPATPTR
jgi:hypothetical protein